MSKVKKEAKHNLDRMVQANVKKAAFLKFFVLFPTNQLTVQLVLEAGGVIEQAQHGNLCVKYVGLFVLVAFEFSSEPLWCTD